MTVELRPRVLVVDDDELARELTSRALGAQNEVLEAPDVATALAVLRAQPIDVAVVDVMMPGVSGLDGCTQLKHAAAPQFLPVLLLTALSSQEQRNQGLAAGADDYLSKPVDRRELQLRVAAFARSARQDRTIRAQVQELRELSALKDDLVQMLVHDLRNPLSAVMSAFNLLQGSGVLTDVEDVRDLETGMQASRRISALLEELLQVRLLEEGKLRPHRTPTRVDEVVRGAVETLRPAALERGVQLHYDARADDETLAVDGPLLQRAIENLLSNAVKYTRGAVDVRAAIENGSVRVTVADRGPGIPEPLRLQLFEKFGSLEASRGQQRRGIGLGLYMVRLVAAAHEGTVHVAEREGGGSLFHLDLPLATAS